VKHNPQYIVLFFYFRQFLEKAAEAGIDVIPLKGAHLLTCVYPEGSDRGPLADVDFLVRPQDDIAAGKLLESLGFYLDPQAHRFEEAHEQGYYLDVSPTERIMFEMHRYLSRFPLDHEKVWRRSVASVFDGVPCRRLSAEDSYVYVVLHETLHRLDNVERAVMDLTHLIKSGEIDSRRVIERAKEWQLKRATWTFSRLLADLGEYAPVSEEIVTALEPPAAVRRILTFLAPDSVMPRFRGLNRRVHALILCSFLLDRPEQVLYRAVTHPCLNRR
jgi:hypothetical protein